MDDSKPDSDENPFDENPLDELASKLSNSLDSKSISLTDSSTDRIEGGQIRMDGSFSRAIQGQAIHMEGSAAGLLKAQSAEIDDSMVGVVATNHATMEEVNSLGLIARTVQADSIFSFFFLAGRVDGDVRSVFTLRTAFAAGVGIGLALFVTKRILMRLWPFGRRRMNNK